MATATLTRTDEQVQTDVLAELKWNAQVQPNEIGVAVKNGVVTLTGWVDSYLKKWSAEEAAHRVNGVKAVANDIEVRCGSAVRQGQSHGVEGLGDAPRRGRVAIPKAGRRAGHSSPHGYQGSHQSCYRQAVSHS